MANRSISSLLSDAAVKTAPIKDKNYRLPDGNGLQLLIKPNGSKIWEIRFTFNGKQRQSTAGNYPQIKLKDARVRRDKIKELVSQGIDPIEAKHLQKQEDHARQKGKFHLVVKEWLDHIDKDITRQHRFFERDIFPFLCTYNEKHEIIDSKLISEITHGELLKIINEKQKTSVETAHRLLASCNRLWQYAVSHGLCHFNIVANISKKDALKTYTQKHYAKITDEKILAELLRAIDNYQGSIIVRNLLRFVTYIPLRAHNLCKLTWDQVDLDRKLIIIPRQQMKMKNPNLPDFTIPLSDQALNILQEQKELAGWGQWVFHGVSNFATHINTESGNKALKLMGFSDEARGRKQTIHSFRGTFRSLTDTYEHIHQASFQTREAVLDHHEKQMAVRAYTHKADYTEAMRPLLQWWADWLDGVKADV